ncbi:MAG: ribose-phosphate pyrophosphokinase-like domain-containing protein, partial [Candidatus Omnitrophota bacterium]
MNGLAVFSGNANPQLAEGICKCLKVESTKVLVGKFSEGETRVKIEGNIRGKDVFIVQPTCPSTNDNLMELLILIDAARRASAE